jgi:hypothetical protein
MATGVPLRVPRWTDAAAPLPRNAASEEGSKSSTDVAASSVYLRAAHVVCVEHEPRSGRVRNPTYIAVTILRSWFAALTAAALVLSLEAWRMI